MKPFTMCGKLIARPGQRDALAALMLESGDQLKSMEGCRLYLINESVDEPDVLWVIELWDSEEAHAASLQREDIREMIGRARPLLAGVEPVKLRLIGGVGV